MGEILSIYNQKRILSGIYKIVFPNGKCYIGQSSNIIRRMREHNCTKKNYPICNAIQKYGPIKEFELLEEIAPEDLEKMNEREQYYINYYNSTVNGNGYNITMGGDGTRRDYNNPIILGIKKDLKEGIGTEEEIAKKFGVDVSTVSDINTGKRYSISEEDYPIRKKRHCHSQSLTEKQINEIILLLKEDLQLSMKDIAEKYNVSVQTIELINQGKKTYSKKEIIYPIRKKGEYFKMFNQAQIEEIIYALKNTSKTQIEIANEYGCERQIIGQINSGKKYFQETETYPIRITNRRKKMIENEKSLGKNGATKIKVISANKEEYIFNSYADMEKAIGLNRQTARRSLELNVVIKQGKYKGWQVKLYEND